MEDHLPTGMTVDPDYWAKALEQGKALRQRTPRSVHAEWSPSLKRPSIVDQINASNEGRVEELIPLRHERMSESAFAFLRGMPPSMARDLADTPNVGVQVQACGDAHLMNFGLFASPERILTFDITDFDETHQAPWEWDVKRLAVSVAIACRQSPLELDDTEQLSMVMDMVASYRQHLCEYSRMTHREIWQARLTCKDLLNSSPSTKSMNRLEAALHHALHRTGTKLLEKLVKLNEQGARRIVDNAPSISHADDGDFSLNTMMNTLRFYQENLQDDRRQLLLRYEILDAARKVVGVGSVGTHCAIALLRADDGDTFLLQIKEARPSVLEPYTQSSPYAHCGQRVVFGQRIMQSASDPFLGWTQSTEGRAYYVRQLRDMKASVPLVEMSAGQLREYAKLCGWCLARAHSKSGKSAILSGYLGKRNIFDQAIGQFALKYADQNERDFQEFLAARRFGQLV